MFAPIKKFLKIGLLLPLLTFSSNTLATEKGLFWQLESPTGKVSYLFGTMHSDDNRLTDFKPAVLDAVKASDVFVMETLSPNSPSVFMMPDGDLTTLLTEPELDKVYELAEFHSMHRSAAMHMKPWLLAVVFDSPRPLTEFSQDNLLMSKAEEQGKDVVGIEDPVEHFSTMDDFSTAEQITMLRAVLKRTPQQKKHDYEALLHAYLSGSSDQVAQLDDKITGGMLPKALWNRMRQKILTDRNTVMAKRIAESAQNKKLFVAVGASHLAGETGLVASLRRAGFKLTPIL
ncbi:MAG: TraB/GumN family protein [Methylophilaceae bacterium]|nr:TraB/GumN family protein [Methylophilaceae bacterium]